MFIGNDVILMNSNMIKAIISKKIRILARVLSHKYGYDFPQYQLNNNLDLCNPTQKKILICYIPLVNKEIDNVTHALLFHANQIVHYFMNKGYCVDICSCHPDNAYQYKLIEKKSYDIVFGFGKVYKQYCARHANCLKILFMTENNPVKVKELYNERIKYFKERHPNVDYRMSSVRMEFYDEEMLELSDALILMGSKSNKESFIRYFDNAIWRINCNIIKNPVFTFDESIIEKKIPVSRDCFLWFGSRGLIHKGLDIVIDAFAEMPELTLNCYGVSETKLFRKLCCPNTINRGRIDVNSQQFIDEVIYRHNFVILDSCSEGMSTAIATCMSHGIIPIVSKESGLDPQPFILELNGYNVNSIITMVGKVSTFSDKEILNLRKQCYAYAQNAFSLEKFNNTFSSIMEECLEYHKK